MVNLFASPAGRRSRRDLLKSLAVACAVALALAACGGRKTRVRLPPVPVIGGTETGLASWYGNPYHGRRAANGEIYDMEKLTAAHRTLPFGTYVRVHNLENSKTVDVRITDRGPFIDGRIIDLSFAAARQIDMVGPGVVRVRLEIIDRPASVDRFAVQVGAFADAGNARDLRATMEHKYGAAMLVKRDGEPPLWRVLVGKDLSEESAAQLATRIRAEYGPAFVVRLDATSTPTSL